MNEADKAHPQCARLGEVSVSLDDIRRFNIELPTGG